MRNLIRYDKLSLENMTEFTHLPIKIPFNKLLSPDFLDRQYKRCRYHLYANMKNFLDKHIAWRFK